MRSLFLALALSLAGPAGAAMPTLQPQTVGGVQLSIPAGWRAVQSAETIWMAQAPEGAAAPTLVLAVVPTPQGPNLAQQLVFGTLPDARLIASEPQPQGTLLQTYEGTGAAGASRIAVLIGIDPHQNLTFIAAFGGPTERFDALGGTRLLLAFAAGSGPGGQAPPQATTPAQSVPVPLQTLAESFEQMPPAQVAASLRALSPSDQTLLGVYPAFANLLHAVGCQADPTLPLPTSMGILSCAATAQQWQQTYQLVGSWDAALSHALSERSTYLVGARCGDGSMSRQDCQLYTQGLSDYNAMSHETSMRILSNMSPDGCLVGDANCVPY